MTLADAGFLHRYDTGSCAIWWKTLPDGRVINVTLNTAGASPGYCLAAVYRSDDEVVIDEHLGAWPQEDECATALATRFGGPSAAPLPAYHTPPEPSDPHVLRHGLAGD